MKKHSISLFSLGIALAVMLLFGQVGTQVRAESSGPEPIVTSRTCASNPGPPVQVSEDWSWVDGSIQYTTIVDYMGNVTNGFGTYVGYFQNAPIYQPTVNSTYYLHVVLYGISFSFSNIYAGITIVLPPNTSLAISPSTPIYCFGGEYPLVYFECNQSLPQVVPGKYSIPSGDASIGNAWPIAAGAGWEFQIPVITSTTLNNSNFIAEIRNIDGYQAPPWLYPYVPIYVWPVQAPGAFGKTSPTSGATGLSTSPTLSWGASSGTTSYSYCYDTTNDNACSTWTNNGAATSKALSELATDTTYYWHVRAENSGGTTYSNASSTAFWSFKTAAPTSAPGAFGKASPTSGATGLSTSPTLSWGASSGASSYSYSYCYDTTNDNTCSTWTNNGAATSKALSGLATDTTYYWHVRAVNGVGTTYSNASSTAFWSFKTAAPGELKRVYLPLIIR